MWRFSGDRLVFPAPWPTYTARSLQEHLVWIPWIQAASPELAWEEQFADGIPCVWLPAPRAAGVVLFCHGNAEDLGTCMGFLKHMRDQFKMNVLAVEYPGYGLLRHVAPSEAAIKEVALAAFRFIVDELRVGYEQIILFGRSLGSGPSIYLASQFPVGGLILVAPFASVRQVIRHLAGHVVARAFEERFSNISLIGNVSCPTLFIHGEKDNVVPASQSLALFEKSRARKLLVTPASLDHNTNLFTDTSFLAVPAINFFGLPGYTQDESVLMPRQCFRREEPCGGREHAERTEENLSWLNLFVCPGESPRATGAVGAVNHRFARPQREMTAPVMCSPKGLEHLRDLLQEVDKAAREIPKPEDEHVVFVVASGDEDVVEEVYSSL